MHRIDRHRPDRSKMSAPIRGLKMKSWPRRWHIRCTSTLPRSPLVNCDPRQRLSKGGALMDPNEQLRIYPVANVYF
jgi:hypothetical protein